MTIDTSYLDLLLSGSITAMNKEQALEMMRKHWEALVALHRYKQSLFEGNAPKRCTNNY